MLSTVGALPPPVMGILERVTRLGRRSSVPDSAGPGRVVRDGRRAPRRDAVAGVVRPRLRATTASKSPSSAGASASAAELPPASPAAMHSAAVLPLLLRCATGGARSRPVQALAVAAGLIVAAVVATSRVVIGALGERSRSPASRSGAAASLLTVALRATPSRPIPHWLLAVLLAAQLLNPWPRPTWATHGMVTVWRSRARATTGPLCRHAAPARRLLGARLVGYKVQGGCSFFHHRVGVRLADPRQRPRPIRWAPDGAHVGDAGLERVVKSPATGPHSRISGRTCTAGREGVHRRASCGRDDLDEHHHSSAPSLSGLDLAS